MKPYVFKTEHELVVKLQAATTRTQAQAFFSARDETVSDAVGDGVAGNTFRAFRNLPVKPSAMFRQWATGYVQRNLDAIVLLAAQNDGVGYAQFMHRATRSLCQSWGQRTAANIGYGRAAKLFNLVMKRIARQRVFDAHRENLISLLHVPLDSYTIVGLLRVASRLGIRRTATMKDIQTPRQYRTFQRKIATIARVAEVTPIYYDILAWDVSHRGRPGGRCRVPVAR